MAQKFERKFEKSRIDKLQNNDLWKNHLKEDCKIQNIFLAVRNNDIGFYHKGGKLFGFEANEYKAHIKYAAVIDNTDKYYLTENEIKTKKLISNFSENYTRIKKNCEIYSGVEAQGVSEIYHKHSYLSNENIVVLDIEVSFEALDKTSGKTQDRIDILLYDVKKQTLKFVEAKHFSNKEIWSESKPKVIGQIKKYEKQIAAKKTEIIKAYENYITAINEIFEQSLPLPIDVEEKVTLLIFGFDQNQKDGRLSDLILNKKEYEGYIVYPKGKINNINLNTLWNCKAIKLIRK